MSLGCSAAFLTSRMKNLAVFTLAQVFFSLETGLMFMPAGRGRATLGGPHSPGRAGVGGLCGLQVAWPLELHPDWG